MTCELVVGSIGANVLIVQKKLQANGYYKGYALDGKYGTKTKQEVARYQGKNGLSADGCIGCVTWDKLVGTKCPWSITPSPQSTPTNSNTVFVSPRYEAIKQQTDYWCGPTMEAQIIYELYGQKEAESYAANASGTSTAGTGHPGIVQGMTTWMNANKHKMTFEWINFSSIPLKQLGEWIADPNIGIGMHMLYKDKWGHYMYPMWLSIATNVFGFVNTLAGTDYSYYDLATISRWCKENAGGQPSIFKVTKIS